ncbi:MAG: hypothetical protein A2066_19740 [Bacteroidetes bacterium GWB2_41_8]|nr:MAG: hypothetical protein A2066_19740 [Bacteroidetes bacterium GWB2_41_8]
MDTTASKLGNNGTAIVYPVWRPNDHRPLIANLKRKERTRPKIGQGLINGFVPRRPCSILFPVQKSI